MPRATFCFILAFAPAMVPKACQYLVGSVFVADALSTDAVDARAGRASCAGQPCERDRWMIVASSSDGVAYGLPGEPCSREYAFDFAETVYVRSISVNTARNLLVASATDDDVVHLSEFGRADALVQIEMPAWRLRWSNAGDRLAAVVEDGGESSVVILSSDLDELSRFGIGSDYVDGVTWSRDDDRIAIAQGYYSEVRCVLIRPADGAVERYDGISCFSIGADQFVGQNVAAMRFEVMTIADGQVGEGVALDPQPLTILDSDSTSGVFLTEIKTAFIPIAVVLPEGLQTVDAGPYRVPDLFSWRSGAELIPIETALPVLEAAGLGPDAPCPE